MNVAESKTTQLSKVVDLGVIINQFLRFYVICEASLQNPQNVAQNEMVVILDYNL